MTAVFMAILNYIIQNIFTILEFIVGLFSKSLKNKIASRKLIRSTEKRLNQLITIQIEKQKKTAKYIPDIFIENHNAKDQCRFFAVPKKFWGKAIWDINTLNFSHLNRQLSMVGIESFGIKIPPQLSKSPNAVSLQTHGNALIKILQEKIKFLDHMRKAEEEGFSGIVPSDKIEYAQKRWYLITSPLYANIRNLENIREDIKALKNRVMLITSKAGRGKTNFVCDFSENVLRKRNIPCVFFTARDFDYNLDDMIGHLFEKIFPGVKDLSINMKFEIIEKLSNRNNNFFIIIIDGLNESQEIKKFSSKLEEFIQTLLQYNFIKVILTCRSEYFNYRFDNIENSSFAEDILRSDKLEMRECEEAKLIDKYFDFFKLSCNAIYGNARYILSQNPLLLRFYCEVYGNQNARTYRNLGNISHIYTDNLFEEYLHKKIDSIVRIDCQGTGIPLGYHDKFKNALKALVEYMITKNQYGNIPIDQIDKQYHDFIHRLIYEDIILREDVIKNIDMDNSPLDVINFTFDEFRDFLIADYLVKSIWPSDKKRFNDFTNDLINVEEQKFGSKTQHLYRPKAIAEGVSKFIFQIVRHKCVVGLEDAVKDEEWYKWTYLDSIFSIEDRYVKDEDINYTKREFITSIQISSVICYQFISRYDISEYKRLNIYNLYDILRILSDESYVKLVDPIFQNYTPKYYEDHFTWKIDLLVKNLRKKLNDANALPLFELLIFLFAIPSQNYWSPALDLFDELAEKHPDYALDILLKNINIAHYGIRIHIWEKIGHFLEKEYAISNIKNLVKNAFAELKDGTKNEYFNRRLSILLLNICNKVQNLLSEEEVNLLEKISRPKI